jgi:hypothetical protein
MKKVVISLAVIVLAVFLVGCLDYKSYEAPAEEDTNLVDEIAALEEELDFNNDEEEDQDIILPELTQEIPEPVMSGEYDYLVTVLENELVNLKVTVFDPDDDEVTYTFSPPIDARGMWKTQFGDAGEYLVTIKATDGELHTEGRVKLVVERVNVKPVLTGVRDMTAREGETIRFEPNVEDPNNDPVTVTISPPLNTGTWVTDHTSAGEYQITVTASDGDLDNVETFTLTVTDVNVLPEITNVVEEIRVSEGETVTIEPIVSDLDNDNLFVSISEPVGDDGVWETGYTDHGTYAVTVTVNDGKDIVTQTVRVIVDDVNKPPQITDVSLGLN